LLLEEPELELREEPDDPDDDERELDQLDEERELDDDERELDELLRNELPPPGRADATTCAPRSATSARAAASRLTTPPRQGAR
jgi:hypothetical protein